ncbi:hypothetical protein L210DRAFT_3551908 [Boletus edulis BED1]|uniref:Uncharacterized protein n=1 Tax=Boletus edulis BED1 TaxID=1328754 RepID=A0AAD4GBS2_BOLED|nr:hypothetical protein L210DRAFT_3551908 [Boletus edulis BED1]
MESFMAEYDHSSHKKQLLSDKQEKLVAVRGHARQCENWQRDPKSEYKIEQQLFQKERDGRIFERLKLLGFGLEIEYFGRHTIRESRRTFFTSKPLTEKGYPHRIC